MSEIIDNLTGYLNELDNYMSRLNTDRLSRKDRKLFLDMSNEYYEIFHQYYENDHNELPEALFAAIESFSDNIANQNKDAVSLANEYYKEITDIAGKFRDTVERIELLSGVFQKDVAAFNLHDEKIAMLQDLVDLDQRMQGKISQETLRVLEVQHCEVVDGRVIEMQEQTRNKETQGKMQEKEKESMVEKKSNVMTINGKEYRVLTDAELDQMIADQARTPKHQSIELTKQLKANGAKFDTANKQWYIMPDNSNIEFFHQYFSETKQEQKNDVEKNVSDSLESDVTPEQFGLDGKATYRAYAYMKGNNQKPKPVYGKNPEEIVAKLQTWNNGRTDAMKLHTCYIQKLNPDTNKFENIGKWDLLSGKDVTPIYLTLPHYDNRSEFNQVVAELKAAGAKYNHAKKAFYITKQDDLNKFAEYLPFSGTRNDIRNNGSKAERNFTIEPGQEYYDNRVQVTIEGMKPVQIYGDDYDVHFPSMSVDETRDIIEKYVLPELQNNHPEKELPSEMEYNGKMYDPLQYDVLKLAERQEFTEEQMSLLEHPELSSDRMNEIRFAIRDGLSPEQIAQFATPAYEQWQMDLCRIGLQHGFTMQDIQPLINPEGYTQDKWGERRNHLQKMVHEKDRANKKSLISRLDNNKEKVSSSQQNKAVVEKNEQKKALPGNVLE